MSERIEIPAEVLAVFRKIRAVADTAVDFLEELQSQPSIRPVSGTAFLGITGTATVQVIRPTGIPSEEHVAGPVVTAAMPPMPTVPEVKMARVWLDAWKPAVAAASAVGVLESLLQFAERLLGIHP
ncbi:hypothetical protein ACWEQG_01725 [Microbispora sp. NPDC004025]